MDIEQALQWVLANYQEYNIASVNMSLSTGGNHVNPTNFGIIGDELQQLAAANVIPVSAAGNTGKFGVSYPAANPYSLAVSSIDDYTNRKISSFSQHHPDLTDVFADGQGIRAANQNGGTTVKSGTSMAAPVAGQSHLISPKEGCAWFSTVSGKFLKTAIASSDNAIANKGIFQSLLLIF